MIPIHEYSLFRRVTVHIDVEEESGLRSIAGLRIVRLRIAGLRIAGTPPFGGRLFSSTRGVHILLLSPSVLIVRSQNVINQSLEEARARILRGVHPEEIVRVQRFRGISRFQRG